MTYGYEPPATPSGQPPAGAPLTRFVMRQRLTMMVNRYEIIAVNDAGQETGLLCLAQQKRMAFKEQVTFYTDESRTRPVFSFKARSRMEKHAGKKDTSAEKAVPAGAMTESRKVSSRLAVRGAVVACESQVAAAARAIVVASQAPRSTRGTPTPRRITGANSSTRSRSLSR